MPIRAFVSTRVDVLLPHLVARLQEAPNDPFARDTVVVPSTAYEHWLSEQLAISLRCPDGTPGTLANVNFLLPGEFYPLAEDSASHVSKLSQLDPSLIACHLLELMCKQPQLAPSFQKVSDRMGFALKIAQLFERYTIDRPDMLEGWAKGVETDGDLPLPPRFRWQFTLWNLLQDRVAPKSGGEGELNSVVTRPGLQTVADQFGRLSLFGLEVLSSRAVRALTSLSNTHEIFLYGTVPSKEVLEMGMNLAQKAGAVDSRKRDAFGDDIDPKHPLLRTWASSAFETSFLLWQLTSDVSYLPPLHRSSLLGVFQDDLALGTNLDEVSPADELSDGTIQIHRAHGVVRQVEIARDAILHILDRDPTLTLRDVLVISPSIDRIAPLIEPVFTIEVSSPNSSKHKSQLSVALLDGAKVESSNASQIVLGFLGLVGSRCTRSEVKTLFNIEAVRVALGFDAEALAKIDKWLEQIDVRWGLDAEHRKRLGYPPDLYQGSWALAADRLVAGAFVQAPNPIEFTSLISPYDDIGSGDFDTLLQFVSLFSMLEEIQRFGEEPQPLMEWSRVLRRITDRLLPNDVAFTDDLEDIIEAFTRTTKFIDALGETLLSAREVHSLFGTVFKNRRAQVRRWADVVRVGSLSRMRGLPARVIVLLGLDEDALTGGSRDGDDILGEGPRIGERDRRADERLALLATAAAATDYFVITAEGFSVTSNSDIAPSIPQTEFAEAVRRSVAKNATSKLNCDLPLVISHSRQLAHPVNLGIASEREGKTVMDLVGAAWTFDSSAGVLARARDQETSGFGDITTLELPPPAVDDLEVDLRLSDLVDAVRRPLRVLLRNRLRTQFLDSETAPEENLMLWPDGLELASLGREWLDQYQQGLDHAVIRKRFEIVGRFPAGALGVAVATQLQSELTEMIAKSGGTPKSKSIVEINSVIGKFRIRDRVVLNDGELRVIDYAKHHQSRRVEPWITLAATVHQQDGKDIAARLVTRSDDKKNKSPILTELRVAGETDNERLMNATKVLNFVVGLREQALCRVLPVFDRASWAITSGASSAEVRKDLERDVERPEYRWCGYQPSLSDLQNFEENVDVGLASVELFRRFLPSASAIASCFASSTLLYEEERE